MPAVVCRATPSPQAVTIGSTNDTYAYHGATTNRNYVTNGLNQYTTVGSNAWNYDGRGNLLSNTNFSYTYDPENRLLTASAPTAVTLTYDPIGHLQTSTASGAATTFLYAGDMLAGEYDSSGNILRRYVPGPGTDEPLVWYEGAGTSDRRWLHADTRGSVIGYSDSSGNSGATYAYDPFGLPNTFSATASRYRYTGQTFIPEAHLYYYKARMYDPQNSRFLQTDPVGYQSDINFYAYVGNDPVNWTDPTGMACSGIDTSTYTAPGGTQVSFPPYYTGCHTVGFADYNGGISGTSGGVGGAGGNGFKSDLTPPVIRPPVIRPPNTKILLPCKPSSSLLGDIANVADNISNGASAVSAVTDVAALATSETIVGGVTFGSVSGASGLVSIGASGVAAAANFFAGRSGNAALDAFGAVFSAATLGGARALPPVVQYIRGTVSTAVTAGASSICPG